MKILIRKYSVDVSFALTLIFQIHEGFRSLEWCHCFGYSKDQLLAWPQELSLTSYKRVLHMMGRLCHFSMIICGKEVVYCIVTKSDGSNGSKKTLSEFSAELMVPKTCKISHIFHIEITQCPWATKYGQTWNIFTILFEMISNL